MNDPQPPDGNRISALGVADFVSMLGSGRPTPGSGAAAAIVLALAAACAAKAFTISVRHTGNSALDAAADRARSIAAIALEGAQRDADDFRAWLASHDGETGKALRDDSRSLFDVAEELRDLITRNEAGVYASLRPDIAAARDLVHAFTAIERRNLETL